MENERTKTLDPDQADLAKQACEAWAEAINNRLVREGHSYSGLARQDMADTRRRLRDLAAFLTPDAPPDGFPDAAR